MSNQLKGSVCYLVGAIDRATDSGKEWRELITPYLDRMGVVTINPLQKNVITDLESDDYRNLRKQLKEEGRFDELAAIMRKVRHIDLRCVDKCDFIIAHLDLDVYAFGTIEEISVAVSQKKPVLVWMKQSKKMCPDWAFSMLPHQFIFESLQEVITYLQEVNTNAHVETYGRWLFFDWGL